MGMGTGCRQDSQPHRSSAFALGSILQPRSLSPAPLQQGSARNHVPVPFPSKGTWMEAAHKRLMSGPQKPPGRMEAWPRFKGALVLYNLSAGDNSQAANERRGLHPRSGEPGTAGTVAAKIRHAGGTGTSPAKVGEGDPPSGSHFAWGCFGGAPRWGQRWCHPVPCFGGTGWVPPPPPPWGMPA